MKTQTRNRIALLGLFGLFFVPVLLAYLMNAGVIHYKPQPSKNHGRLIDPPINMKKHSSKWALNQADDLWKLVYVHAGKTCDSQCEHMLDAIYRIYLATGRHRTKVRPVVVFAQAGVHLPAVFAERFSQVSIADDDKARQLFADLSTASLGQGNGFYIIAPEGFLMMSYPKGFDPSGTIKDMNVLLKRKDG